MADISDDRSSEDKQIGNADPYATRVPKGQYRVALDHWDKGTAYGSPRWFGHFRITEDGPYLGLPILRFWNEPRAAFLPRSHNLSLDFMAVIGTCPPSSGLTPSDFLDGCEVLAEVTTVKHRSEGRKRIIVPDGCHYSKINRLIGITAGCPPCLRKAPNR